MSSNDKYVSREIVGRALKQIQQTLISQDSRLGQLFSRKPIDLYDAKTTLTFNEAEAKLDIKSYLENVLQKTNKKSGLWPFNNWSNQNLLNYKFNVVVNGKMDYPNIETWIRNTFKDEAYTFKDGRYLLKLREVKRVSSNNNKLEFKLDLFGSIRIWKFKFKTKAVLTFEVEPTYDAKDYTIKVKDVDYKLETANILMKILDKYYHKDFKEFLKEVIEISIKEDLFTGRILAQEEINKYQKAENLIFNGFIHDLELERFEVQKNGIEAVFLANGNLQFVR